MARDYVWTDDTDQPRRSTEIILAADVTAEILALAATMEDAWFSKDIWIDWRSFFDDLDGSMIPSTNRELDLGDEPDSPAMTRIQRYIRKRRMSRS